MENLNYKAAELQHIGNNLIYLTKESMEVPYRSYGLIVYLIQNIQLTFTLILL